MAKNGPGCPPKPLIGTNSVTGKQMCAHGNRSQWLLLSGLTLLCSSHCIGGQALPPAKDETAFEVFGVLHVSELRGFPVLTSVVSTVQFSFAREGTNWFLQTTDRPVTQNPQALPYRHVQTGFRGADIHTVVERSSNGVPAHDLVSTQRQAYITAGPIPTFDPMFRLVWLAFSGAWPPGPIVTNVQPPWYAPQGDLVDAVSERSILTPGLPSNSTFYSPGQRDRIAGRYRVESWTNWSGLSLPLRATLVRYLYSIRDTGPLVGLEATMSVSDIRPLRSPLELPSVADPIRITDYRFQHLGPGFFDVVYTNSQWAQTNDADLQTTVASKAKSLRFGVPRPPSWTQKLNPL